jgi:hypothetical protein
MNWLKLIRVLFPLSMSGQSSNPNIKNKSIEKKKSNLYAPHIHQSKLIITDDFSQQSLR